MNELKDEIEAAREKVAYCRIRAERPSSRLEDEFALEKARTRLLTLELRLLKLGQGQRAGGNQIASEGKQIRTKHVQKVSTARERAEAAFGSLQRAPGSKQTARVLKGGD
ncbi:hypothetical protein [Labrenzia sp. OB1]|uniref:hypothetical protein n=1 Tax=Labrenzia sp. OB1 TaxID=1561204 RepID=UPI0007B265E7|nr:hypothetical protein [Labrenzia sp. OB1]KZM48998.1 hypothetical protein OA90_17600 [Labrenzia sp. OB1]